MCSRRPSGHCRPWGERWRNPPHPPHPSSPGLGSKSTPDQQCQPGGNENVSSLLFIAITDLWTCFASLLLYVMIKYCLSAQWIPKAKGKSLCPHIICKLSLSPRTDLFTGRESVLYYPAVTLVCLSSLFNVMPSHSCLLCEIYIFPSSRGGEMGIKTYLSGNHNLIRGKSLYSCVSGELGKKAKTLKSSNLTQITL